MLHYQINIYWSQEDEAYLAEVPELPGCMADGETYQEAAEHGLEVMQEIIEILHNEKKPLPVPKIHQDLGVEAA